MSDACLILSSPQLPSHYLHSTGSHSHPSQWIRRSGTRIAYIQSVNKSCDYLHGKLDEPNATNLRKARPAAARNTRKRPHFNYQQSSTDPAESQKADLGLACPNSRTLSVEVASSLDSSVREAECFATQRAGLACHWPAQRMVRSCTF